MKEKWEWLPLLMCSIDDMLARLARDRVCI